MTTEDNLKKLIYIKKGCIVYVLSFLILVVVDNVFVEIDIILSMLFLVGIFGILILVIGIISET